MIISFHPSQLRYACRRLVEKTAVIDRPQLIIGILNGGGYVGRLVHETFPEATYCELSLHRRSTQRKSRLAPLLRRLPTPLVDRLRVIEARRLARQTPAVIQPLALPDNIAKLAAKATEILIVDDAVDSGVTMKRVADAVSAAAPAGSRIITAAITVTTPTPVIMPDICLYNDGSLIRFPWSNDYNPRRPAPDPELPQNMAGMAVVCDLDGTLLTVNSWPCFAAAVLAHEVMHGRFKTAVRLTGLYLASKRGQLTHRQVKHAFARRSLTYPVSFFDGLSRRLRRHINPQVMRLLTEAQSRGATLIISTAAAGEYARPLIESIERIHSPVIITSSSADCPEDEYIESRGQTKVAMVASILANQGLTPAVVLTDNSHDLPLLKAWPKALRLLVRPSRKDWELCAEYADLVLP